MMKSRIAEWLLSQVLPPDRAATTIGDWMEDAEKRGNLWFWSCVIRTAISSLWSGLTEKPLTMAGIGLLGFARSLLVIIGISAVIRVLWLWSHSFSLPQWLLLTLYYPLQAWWYFQTGRWVARRAPGREVAGAFAIALIGWLPIVGWWMVALIQFRWAANAMVPTAVSHDLCLLAGALWLRRRQLRPATR